MSFLIAFFHRQFFSEPPVQTTSFQGKTIIITGSNVGLGLEASRRMIELGAAKVILACRNVEKGKAAVIDIQTTTSCPADRLEVWQLNLSSYASVRAFADRVKTELPRLDAVNGNAGIGTRTFRMTEDNEESITTNVVSLFLLAFLLHPKLCETAAKFNAQTHFSVTASELYEVAKFKESKVPNGQIFDTLNDKKTALMGDRYNVSKLLEILMVQQLAILSPVSASNVIINSVAPGLCSSQLHREVGDGLLVRVLLKIFARKAEVGSRTLVYGASAGPETHGEYLPDCKITKTLGPCKGDAGVELRNRVWVELREKLENIQPGVTSIT